MYVMFRLTEAWKRNSKNIPLLNHVNMQQSLFVYFISVIKSQVIINKSPEVTANKLDSGVRGTGLRHAAPSHRGAGQKTGTRQASMRAKGQEVEMLQEAKRNRQKDRQRPTTPTHSNSDWEDHADWRNLNVLDTAALL